MEGPAYNESFKEYPPVDFAEPAKTTRFLVVPSHVCRRWWGTYYCCAAAFLDSRDMLPRLSYSFIKAVYCDFRSKYLVNLGSSALNWRSARLYEFPRTSKLVLAGIRTEYWTDSSRVYCCWNSCSHKASSFEMVVLESLLLLILQNLVSISEIDSDSDWVLGAGFLNWRN